MTTINLTVRKLFPAYVSTSKNYFSARRPRGFSSSLAKKGGGAYLRKYVAEGILIITDSICVN